MLSTYLEYRSIADLNRVIISSLSVFPHDVDVIVGIPRSGMLPANLLALYLNRRFTDIDSFVEGKVYRSGHRGCAPGSGEMMKVLVIDDSLYSGKAMLEVRERLRPLSGEFRIEYAAVFVTSENKGMVDYYCEVIDYPRVFQWNIFHHPFYVSRACFDIDGVLCENPPIDDDGPLYMEYIANAEPLYIPSVEIDTLITCRLEKYREITEQWLRRHNVRYRHLIMLDLRDKAARAAWGRHGEYKGEHYRRSGNILFIESSLSEAEQIARISGKPVFCTETFDMVNGRPMMGRLECRLRLGLRKMAGLIRRI